MNIQEIIRQVDEITWFHMIDLRNGIVTPGMDHSSEKLKIIGLPADLLNTNLSHEKGSLPLIEVP